MSYIEYLNRRLDYHYRMAMRYAAYPIKNEYHNKKFEKYSKELKLLKEVNAALSK